MWRWIFVNLLVFSATSTQPISDHEGRECCPCPKPGPVPDLTTGLPRSDLLDDCPCRANVLRSSQDGDFAWAGGADQDLAGTAGEGTFDRAGAVDDCPCRLRNADSVGAPSVFFPSAERALRPVMSDKETKPLLHPEVGLASSVLDTLREATDEEYQEALARDAVRSVLQAPDIDDMRDVSSAIDTARNIVNVILKPNDSRESRDDTEQEASYVQESRCIHPLGRSNSLNLQYSPTSVNKVFATPNKESIALLHKNKNIWDMDSNVGASDVHEQIIDGTGNRLQGLKLKSNPSLFNLFPEKNYEESDKQIKFTPFKDKKKIFSDFKEADTTESPLDALSRKIDDSLTDLKLKLDDHLQTIKNDNADKLKSVLDSANSPSMTNLAFKPLVSTKKFDVTTINPLPLKSLFKLKDVELVPSVKSSNSDLNKARNIPELIPSNHKDKESSKDLFKNFKTVDLGDLITNALNIGFKNSNHKGGTDNIQPIPKGIFKSGIIDADTSPSEIKNNVYYETHGIKDCDDNKNIDSLMHNQSSMPEAKNTEILETLPKSTEVKKLHTNSTPAADIECQSNDVKPLNSNINDLPENVNNLPKTEIIDTIPSSSNVHQVEFEDENIDSTTEDSNEVSRSDVGFEADNIEIADDDSSSIINSMENSREDDELNEENMNGTVISNESEQNSEENCLEEPVKHQDPVPETNNNLSNHLSSLTANDDSNEACVDDNHDLDKKQETKNNFPNINPLFKIPTNDDSKEACVDDNHDLDRKQEIKNNFSNINPLFKKSTLASLKEDVLKKLDKLKKPTNVIVTEKNEETNKLADIKDEECDGEENTAVKAAKGVESENTTSKALDIEDLQNMSDKLLDISTQKDQDTFASENIQCSISPNSETISHQIQDPIDENVDVNSSEDTAAESAQNINSAKDKDSISETSNIVENTGRNDESIATKNKCSSNFDQKSDPVPEGNIRNEMTAEGSDPAMDNIVPEMQYKPSLLHNIFHPKPLNIGNSLKAINFGGKDIAANLKLPSLDHVRDNLASIFEPKDNIKFSIGEDENITDDYNTMSVDASAPTFKSVLPSLQPLEDINLDFFQLSPLKLPDPRDLLPHIPSLPQLNLNSYKAKLAVPKALNLKPMKLESSLGGKNGLFGATLTIGSDKGSKLFGGPFSLNNLPTLEELHSNLRESAQNLLVTPLDITGRNIIDDSLRSSQTLADNFRSHAKNTMKDIQQTLQTRLKDVQQSDLSILADPFKDPQEFLQAVSRTHEDVTDKLKAIHYDLNDRLESIRDRITDQSLLPTLNTPMMRQSSLTFGSQNPSLLSPSYSKPLKKVKASSKSKGQSSSRVGSSRTKTAKSKTLKMPAAHSVPVPKTVEAPKLKAIATPSPPPFVLKDHSFRTPQLANKKSFTEMLKEPVSRFRESKIPVLGKYRPTENKVKISFGTTTLRPDLSRNSPLATKLNVRPTVARKPTFLSNTKSPINSGSHRLGWKSRPFSDANGAPSEIVATKLAPVNVKETENNPSLTIPKKPLSEFSKPKSLLYKSNSPINNRFTNGHSSGDLLSSDKSASGSQGNIIADPKLGTPKNVDILTSLREAVRARLSNLTPITNNNKIVQPDSSVLQPDMLKSASENVETKVDSLMRENASYTCKMICTRNN